MENKVSKDLREIGVNEDQKVLPVVKVLRVLEVKQDPVVQPDDKGVVEFPVQMVPRVLPEPELLL